MWFHTWWETLIFSVCLYQFQKLALSTGNELTLHSSDFKILRQLLQHGVLSKLCLYKRPRDRCETANVTWVTVSSRVPRSVRGNLRKLLAPIILKSSQTPLPQTRRLLMLFVTGRRIFTVNSQSFASMRERERVWCCDNPAGGCRADAGRTCSSVSRRELKVMPFASCVEPLAYLWEISPWKTKRSSTG